MPLTNWKRLRKLSYNRRYCWGPEARMLDDADWYRDFQVEAKANGAEIEVVKGYVYVVFKKDTPPTPPKNDHDCWENATPYTSDGPLGHGWECGICGKFLQAG